MQEDGIDTVDRIEAMLRATVAMGAVITFAAGGRRPDGPYPVMWLAIDAGRVAYQFPGEWEPPHGHPMRGARPHPDLDGAAVLDVDGGIMTVEYAWRPDQRAALDEYCAFLAARPSWGYRIPAGGWTYAKLPDHARIPAWHE